MDAGRRAFRFSLGRRVCGLAGIYRQGGLPGAATVPRMWMQGWSGISRPDGHCVGFRELDKVCGNRPERCIFENAPGTGANGECSLAPHRSKNDPGEAGY